MRDYPDERDKLLINSGSATLMRVLSYLAVSPPWRLNLPREVIEGVTWENPKGSSASN